MQLVDIARYPVDRMDQADGAAFVHACAEDFKASGALVLPGFLTQTAVAAIAADAETLIDRAFFCRSDHTVFLDDGAHGLDPSDPRARPLQTRVGSIANDLLPPAGALQRLYDWTPLTRFVGAVLGHSDLYCGADPLGALSVNVYGQGDLHEWHFDESQFSVTIMVQEAEQGGHFEFIPGLRAGEGADLDTIRQVLDGDTSLVQRLAFNAGSLSIFGGRNTLHRVTEVNGERPRLVAVLTYDTSAGSVNSDAVRQLFWGRTA